MPRFGSIFEAIKGITGGLSDAATTTVGTTATIISYVKGILGLLATSAANQTTLLAGNYRQATKTIVFDGSAGHGAAGETITLFTVTGTVQMILVAKCTEAFVGGVSATLAVGLTGLTTIVLIAQTLVTAFVAGKLWGNATGGNSLYSQTDFPNLMHSIIAHNITTSVLATAITQGTMEYDVLWRPVSAGATLVAA